MGIAAIDRKLEALKAFQDSAPRRVIDQAKEFEAEIIDLNTAQLYEGRESTGAPITPAYRPLTVTIKRAKGQPTDRVTLKDTGDYYASFKVRFGPEYLAIYATDGKAEKLERKYGEDVYGLDENSLQEVIDLIREPLIETFKKTVA